MWLLKTFGSNRMKHLIPYLQDDQKAADYLRQLRWPDGVTCPRCGSDAVEPARTMRQRTAALQLCALRCALGPAICHVHGLDQFDLRREQVASPRMVVGDGLVAVEAERHRNCRRCCHPRAGSTAV